jgi:hypothetical protein
MRLRHLTHHQQHTTHAAQDPHRHSTDQVRFHTHQQTHTVGIGAGREGDSGVIIRFDGPSELNEFAAFVKDGGDLIRRDACSHGRCSRRDWAIGSDQTGGQDRRGMREEANE